jgi:surface antigen
MLRKRIVRLALGFALLVTIFSAYFFLPARSALADVGNNYPWKSAPFPNQIPDTWGYYERYCTSWAAWAVHNRDGVDVPRGLGNADTWASHAKQDGIKVNTTPAIGAVAQWGNYSWNHNAGHVAWVENVNSSTSITVEEYNFKIPGGWDTRTVTTSGKGSLIFPNNFIHFEGNSPPPPVDNAQFISQSPYPTVQPNQQFSIFFQLQNTGNTTWSDRGGYVLACLSTCMGANNGGFNGQSVSPQQSWTFNIYMAAPSSPGQYNTKWQLSHNGTLFGPGLSILVTVQQPADNSAFVGQSNWPTVGPSQQFSIYFILQNTGSTTWTDSDGYSLTCTENCMGAGNVGLNGQSISPGQQWQFNINLIAPSSPGVYRTGWIMDHNGTLFGVWVYIDVTVQGTDNSAFVGQSVNYGQVYGSISSLGKDIHWKRRDQTF